MDDVEYVAYLSYSFQLLEWNWCVRQSGKNFRYFLNQVAPLRGIVKKNKKKKVRTKGIKISLKTFVRGCLVKLFLFCLRTFINI